MTRRPVFNDYDGNNQSTKSVLLSQEIFAKLKEKIESGDEGYQNGDKFPAATTLQREFEATRSAIDCVRERLYHEGYLTPINPQNHRQGFRVK